MTFKFSNFILGIILICMAGYLCFQVKAKGNKFLIYPVAFDVAGLVGR